MLRARCSTRRAPAHRGPLPLRTSRETAPRCWRTLVGAFAEARSMKLLSSDIEHRTCAIPTCACGPKRVSYLLPLRTNSDSAAFARATSTALAGEGRAAGIARASVVGVQLHMHPDVGVCSIGYDQLMAVLLLRHQRGHAVPSAPRLWNGRSPTAPRSRGRAQPLSQANGEPPTSARSSVVGVKLHMRRDVGLCSIGHDELRAVLLLR